MVGERLLQRVQLAVLCEPLNSFDLRPVGLDRKHHAALHEDAVHENGARAAVPGIAADVAAGQIDVVADEMDEQSPRIDFPLVGLAVDLDTDRFA